MFIFKNIKRFFGYFFDRSYKTGSYTKHTLYELKLLLKELNKKSAALNEDIRQVNFKVSKIGALMNNQSADEWDKVMDRPPRTFTLEDRQ